MDGGLAQKLKTYNEQLAQVENLLANDPRNEQFLKLRSDLLEVTKLTEDLLKYNHENAASGAAAVEEEEEGTGVVINPYAVGARCEALFGEKWYPAVVAQVVGEAYTVVFIGFGNSEVVDADSIRPLLCDETLDPSTITVGYVCEARYSGDNKYYEAVVEEITDFGYKVAFSAYGNSEELPLEYMRLPGKSGAREANSHEVTRQADGSYKIPEHLRVVTADTEAERQRKRRKVKALKQKVKTKETDDARDAKKDSWQAFQGRGAKRKVMGSMKSVRKESIFASPSSVEGKVGVTGSGKAITEFGERKKWKAADE